MAGDQVRHGVSLSHLAVLVAIAVVATALAPWLFAAATSLPERRRSVVVYARIGEIPDAAKQIVAYADEIDADLIVVGSRGLGAIGGTLLGSVSRRILHEAKRPVLIVREVPETVPVA